MYYRDAFSKNMTDLRVGTPYYIINNNLKKGVFDDLINKPYPNCMLLIINWDLFPPSD